MIVCIDNFIPIWLFVLFIILHYLFIFEVIWIRISIRKNEIQSKRLDHSPELNYLAQYQIIFFWPEGLLEICWKSLLIRLVIQKNRNYHHLAGIVLSVRFLKTGIKTENNVKIDCLFLKKSKNKFWENLRYSYFLLIFRK